MPTPTPTSNKTLGIDNHRQLAPSSSSSSLRERVRNAVTSRSSSRSRTRVEPTVPTPSGPQFAPIISTEPRNVEDLARANGNGPALVMAPSTESITGTNEYRTSPTSSVPTPTQARAFTVGTTPTVPESQLLSPIRDSDTASITSTASGRKRRLWRRSSTTSTSSPKQQRSTALPNVFAASVTNARHSSSSPAVVAADPSRSSSTPASQPRRKSTAVKRSPALSGHHAAASQSSIESPTGIHSRQNSLTARPTEHESDYGSSAEGHDDDVEDDSDDDALLAELNDGDIPVTGFAVASNKRNADFHELFKSTPEGDYLIEGMLHS